MWSLVAWKDKATGSGLGCLCLCQDWWDDPVGLDDQITGPVLGIVIETNQG